MMLGVETSPAARTTQLPGIKPNYNQLKSVRPLIDVPWLVKAESSPL